jgi:hypothetical protein
MRNAQAETRNTRSPRGKKLKLVVDTAREVWGRRNDAVTAV